MKCIPRGSSIGPAGEMKSINKRGRCQMSGAASEAESRAISWGGPTITRYNLLSAADSACDGTTAANHRRETLPGLQAGGSSGSSWTRESREEEAAGVETRKHKQRRLR